jgi:Carboxypeptidase regulatory-like domain
MNSPTRTMTKLIAFVTLFALVDLGVASPLRTQELARVRGLLVDRQGAVICKQFIGFEGESFKRTIQSDDSGRFEVELPAGKYKLSVACFGFQYFAQDIVLKTGSNGDIDIELETAPGSPRLPHPAVVEPEVTIEAVHAPVFQKMAPMKLK